MITHNNLHLFLEGAKFKKNMGSMPVVKAGKEVIVKFCDGSYGYNSHRANYYWGFGTAYPIVEYAIVDSVRAAEKVALPAFNDVTKILPAQSYSVDSGLFESVPVLGLLNNGTIAIVVFCKNELRTWWMTDCKLGYNVTDTIVGWLELSYKAVVE